MLGVWAVVLCYAACWQPMKDQEECARMGCSIYICSESVAREKARAVLPACRKRKKGICYGILPPSPLSSAFAKMVLGGVQNTQTCKAWHAQKEKEREKAHKCFLFLHTIHTIYIYIYREEKMQERER